MTDLVVSDRVAGRVLAVLPAIAVAVCVRALTLGQPPAALRVLAAAVVALSGWTAFRLLTVKVVAGADGVRVRGVFYDAHVRYLDLTATDVSPHWLVRALLWGLVHPQAVELRSGPRALRPLALMSVADDDDVQRIIAAVRARAGAAPVEI